MMMIHDVWWWLRRIDDDCRWQVNIVALADWTMIAGDRRRFIWIEVMILFSAGLLGRCPHNQHFAVYPSRRPLSLVVYHSLSHIYLHNMKIQGFIHPRSRSILLNRGTRPASQSYGYTTSVWECRGLSDWAGVASHMHSRLTKCCSQSLPMHRTRSVGCGFFFVKKTLSRNERWKQSGFAGFEVQNGNIIFSTHCWTQNNIVTCRCLQVFKHIHQVMAVAMSTRNPAVKHIIILSQRWTQLCTSNPLAACFRSRFGACRL